MKKLLVLCPSRGRPFRLMEMIESFRDTVDTDHTDLMVLLDKDDSYLGLYLDKIPPDIKYKVYDRDGDVTYTTEILNRAFNDSDYQFYSVTNDDIHYETVGWDKKMCDVGKVSSGVERNMVARYGKMRHGVHIEGFPITSVIDADIARKVGWIQHPDLVHSCGDNVWYWIARRLGILSIHRDITYVHKSAYFNDGEADETFNRTNVCGNLKKDAYTYRRWLKYDINKTLDKIRELDLVKTGDK